MFDLALADYNQKVSQNDIINQSLLLEAKGQRRKIKRRSNCKNRIHESCW